MLYCTRCCVAFCCILYGTIVCCVHAIHYCIALLFLYDANVLHVVSHFILFYCCAVFVVLFLYGAVQCTVFDRTTLKGALLLVFDNLLEVQQPF